MRKFLVLTVALGIQFIFVMPCFAIKIGLVNGASRVGVGTSTQGQIINANTNKLIYTLSAMKAYELRAYHDSIAIRISGDYYNLKTNYAVIKPAQNAFISTKGKWYRGFFIVYNRNGALTVINHVDIEDYIKGVVPSEMPSGWCYEAHKAQAIAARSYALANIGKRASCGYDLKDTPEDQAYGGASAESARTNKAVEDTKNIVLIYDLKIIPAYYSASAGGQTSSSADVWIKNLPYLKSVPSFDNNIKKNGHGVGMSQHGANNLAKNGYNSYQILQYFYKGVQFARINPDYYK
ncbi:MAG: SpoIID/LytB domain-containing protein [Candidatus Gastranaerophilales bacterium]|nr:SpoIID/LytB domain-containing protein [Candidatus Gastranaerophilales bacterium]